MLRRVRAACVCFLIGHARISIWWNGEACCSLMALFRGAKSRSSCRLLGPLGFLWELCALSRHPVPRRHYASGGKKKRSRGKKKLSADMRMAATTWCKWQDRYLRSVCWTLPLWHIGTVQIGRLCADGPDYTLSLAPFLPPSVSFSLCPLLFFPPFQLLKRTHWLGYRHLVAK